LRRVTLGVAVAGTLVFGGALVLLAADHSRAVRAAERLVAVQIRRDLVSGARGDPATALDQLTRTLPPGTRALEVLRPDRLDSSLTGTRSSVYQDLVDRLLAQARRFSLWNLCLFAVTLVLAVWPGRSSTYLIVPAAVLAGATVLAAAFYLLAEDWLLAFATARYGGYIFVVIWGAAAALLADIAFNEARVTALLARGLWHWQP
jgi:hypothetical protein